MHVVIEGTLGSGKTTLMEYLSNQRSFKTYPEPVESNPYLSLSYANPKRWMFAMQVDLLTARFRLHQKASMAGETRDAAQDRGLIGDYAFATLHAALGNVEELESSTYLRLYHELMQYAAPPDLVVFLRVDPDEAMRRIRHRDRTCEVMVDEQYVDAVQMAHTAAFARILGTPDSMWRSVPVMEVQSPPCPEFDSLARMKALQEITTAIDVAMCRMVVPT